MIRASMALVVLGHSLGGKDYQVTEKDFANWKAALAGRKDVTFKFYPNLFHLFMPGNKTPPITRSRAMSRRWLWTTSPHGFRDCIRPGVSVCRVKCAILPLGPTAHPAWEPAKLVAL
jgi:hypothetical protein